MQDRTLLPPCGSAAARPARGAWLKGASDAPASSDLNTVRPAVDGRSAANVAIGIPNEACQPGGHSHRVDDPAGKSFMGVIDPALMGACSICSCAMPGSPRSTR